MTTATLVSPADFWQPFRTYAHTAYRLETLQSYAGSGEDAEIRAFTTGAPRPRTAERDAWTQIVAANHRDGKVQQRVHVVTEPLTGYLRYELTWSYGPNIPAGEDIRIIPVRPGEWPGDLPREDYWLFDSRDLYAMHYAADGTWEGAEHVTDPARVVDACAWRDAALHLGVPWQAYIAAHPELQHHLTR